MRNRPINRWLVGVLLLVLLAGLGYALFPFLIDEERYRKPLEAGASFALGRRVTVEGPITFSLSLHPTLVLEDVHIANPSWASRSDLLQATRLEAQLSFLGLLRREVVVTKVFFDGVDLLLEEGPQESNNWTFGTPSESSASSQEESPISATITEEGFIGIQRVTIAYQPNMASSPESQVTIIEGTVLPVEDRTREFSVRGTFRDTPFTMEMIGGKVIDLFDLTEPWPIDGFVAAASTTLTVKGKLIGPLAASSLELTGALQGERLSDINSVLDMDFPHYGPYELITSLSFSEDTLNLRNIRAKIGESEFGGDLKLLNQAEKVKLSGKLTANSIQVNDFRSSEPDTTHIDTPDPQHSTETFASQNGMEDIDIDLEFAVNTFLVDQQNLGRIALSAKLEKGLLRVAPFRAETYGGVIAGSFELDGNHQAPRVTLEATGQDWDYGQALQAFDVTSEIAGSTDLAIAISGQGATLQEFLDHTTLAINAGPSSLVFGKEESSDKMVVGINQVLVKAAQGEAVKARAKGVFMEKALDVALVTGSINQLRTPDKPWPISLLARSEDASLTIKGGLKSEAEGMRAALAVSLSGQQLNRLDPNLPPSGPYVFRAQLINSGSEYFLKNLKGQVGQSDVTGFVSLDMEEDIPHLSAAFSSSYIDVADFTNPRDATSSDATSDDIPIPVDSLQALDAEISWKIKRIWAETVQLSDLTVDGNLKNGRLAFTNLKGDLFDRKKPYAKFQGELVLDTTADIPTLSGKTSIQNLNYGHLLKRFVSNSQLVGTTNLDAHFSSKGNTLFTILTQPTFKIGTQGLRIPLNDQQDEGETLLNVIQATLSSKSGGPLFFSAQGSFKERPFTIASSSGALRQLIKDIHQWPLAIAVKFPQLSIDLKGHLLFPINSEDFSFQVSVKGDTSHELSFIPETELSFLGPFTFTSQLTQIKEGYRATELKAQWGPNDMAGHAILMTTGPRLKLVASLNSESVEIDFLTKELAPSTDPEPDTIFKSVARGLAEIGTTTGKSVVGLGKEVGQEVTKPLGVQETDDENETPVASIFPDFEFPVDVLRSIDLDFDWQIQKVKSKGTHLGNLSYDLTLEAGLLKMGPLRGTLWHGTFDGKIKLDASQYVPTLEVRLKIQDLDLGFLDDTVGVTDLVNGEIDLIKLNLKSRGTTLHEVLNRANGEAELVEGPIEITNDYVDLWAADIFRYTLTKAWEKEEATKINCAVGYFDIKEGEIQSDAILIDTKEITVGGFGTIDLSSENIDLILTPQPKNPTLATLAHPVRISGHLSDPDVSSDKLRIAQGGGWYLLGLVNPIGLTLVIPKIAGTTFGTGEENPCVAAMSDKEFTVREVSELQEDFWDWMARKMKGVFTSNGDSQKPPPNSENGEP